MSGPLEIVLILAAICYVMVRRMMGEPARAKRMLVLPAVLGVIGLSDVSGQVKTPLSVVFLVATAAISVGIGALRGASVRISERDGLAFVQYTGLTVALWVVNLVIKFGANFALKAVDPKDAGALSNSLLLALGAGMLMEGLVVLYRALRSDHQVMWQEGKNGAPRQMSPFMDNLRHSLNDRGISRDYNDGQEGWGTQTGPRRDDAFFTDSRLVTGPLGARRDYRRERRGDYRRR
jgi:hypothetical protein